MGERLSNLFPLALMVLLAALTYWLDRVVQSPAAAPNALLRHDPDYIVDKLLATRMDVSGRIKNTLHSVKLTHFPDDDTTDLEAPRFISYAKSAPVTITAKTGLVSSNGENVYFRDSVRVVRAPYGEKSEMVVNTDYLHVLPDDNIAKTDRAVTITDANMVVNAVGMEMNSETRIVLLNARVKGTYYDAKRAGKAGQ
ncbi:MAG: LPS export ABC transporter periplasmic protein LptC [Burkholderiales bacterium]